MGTDLASSRLINPLQPLLPFADTSMSVFPSLSFCCSISLSSPYLLFSFYPPFLFPHHPRQCGILQLSGSACGKYFCLMKCHRQTTSAVKASECTFLTEPTVRVCASTQLFISSLCLTLSPPLCASLNLSLSDSLLVSWSACLSPFSLYVSITISCSLSLSPLSCVCPLSYGR